MANSDFKGASIRLIFDNGLDDKGKVKKKVKVYQNVTEEAAADAIFEVARVLGEFGTKPLMFLEKQKGETIYG
ncbi:DUF1659 domain-containing protein [Planococcus sp. N028]|uniref:DUF1659 domain-containing protein n=1 Tax=Planococcus shixiaomingii TaxID=3058393 RepID=A0ABT8MY67_9BACL|nr:MULTISPECIES: DUF1659 domain-containing protein [unclassified Planococcus (in: firmicutes)]MDN7240543.1 DUF1659 domain-containing protein [Planococcus sp. N028]WKA56436.1 DUF1659 domain-containing protein [Planococcus sp. N022]